MVLHVALAETIAADLQSTADANKRFEQDNLTDPVTQETLRQPVMLKCGHVHERRTVEQIRKTGKPQCSVCRAPMGSARLNPLTEVNLVKDTVEHVHAVNRQLQQPQRKAEQLVSLLKACVRSGDFSTSRPCES